MEDLPEVGSEPGWISNFRRGGGPQVEDLENEFFVPGQGAAINPAGAMRSTSPPGFSFEVNERGDSTAADGGAGRNGGVNIGGGGSSVRLGGGPPQSQSAVELGRQGQRTASAVGASTVEGDLRTVPELEEDEDEIFRRESVQDPDTVDPEEAVGTKRSVLADSGAPAELVIMQEKPHGTGIPLPLPGEPPRTVSGKPHGTGIPLPLPGDPPHAPPPGAGAADAPPAGAAAKAAPKTAQALETLNLVDDLSAPIQRAPPPVSALDLEKMPPFRGVDVLDNVPIDLDLMRDADMDDDPRPPRAAPPRAGAVQKRKTSTSSRASSTDDHTALEQSTMTQAAARLMARDRRYLDHMEDPNWVMIDLAYKGLTIDGKDERALERSYAYEDEQRNCPSGLMELVDHCREQCAVSRDEGGAAVLLCHSEVEGCDSELGLAVL